MSIINSTEINHSVQNSFDYRIDGYKIYFISVSTREKKNFFGSYKDKNFKDKTEGKILVKVWKELNLKFPFCILGDYRLTPNEFYGLLIFEQSEHLPALEKTIPKLIACFKARAARLLNLMHGNHNRIIWNNNYINISIDWLSELQIALEFLNNMLIPNKLNLRYRSIFKLPNTITFLKHKENLFK